MREPIRTLSVAVATRRVAAVFLLDGKVKVTKLSRTAANCPIQATETIEDWVASFAPHFLISENAETAIRKGAHSKRILEVVADCFTEAAGKHILVTRIQNLSNKYEEAEALVRLHPEMTEKLPEHPPIWEEEPHRISLFEALSFFEQARPEL